MERLVGTVSRGMRAPIIREGDDLERIVTDVILEGEKAGEYRINHNDIVAITESIVARVQGNYATIDQKQVCNMLERYCQRNKKSGFDAQLSK